LQAELELLSEESSCTQRLALERAGARVQRLSSLIERLLVLALPEEHLATGFETLSLADLASDVYLGLTPEQQARVGVEPGTEGLVRGDAQLLRSLIANGLENALKFSSEGVVSVQIDEGPLHGAGQVELQIRDMGAGIAPELRQQVFQAFYRVRPQVTGGYGLGLALIGHIARVHGGRAEFVDVPQGACLRVLLPAWAPTPGTSRDGSVQ
jgi:two-component system OmpR family sensor kinase